MIAIFEQTELTLQAIELIRVYESYREYANTVKPVNKGHTTERQNMVFIDKWSSGLYLEVILFYFIKGY